MKNLFITLGNLIVLFNFTIYSLLGVLWYGKLPKVSYYHWNKYGSLYSTKGIYNDVNHQVVSVDDVPTRVKQRIIDNYIEQLRQNEIFKANVNPIDIPIFDGKEIIGLRGIYSLLDEVKEQQL